MTAPTAARTGPGTPGATPSAATIEALIGAAKWATVNQQPGLLNAGRYHPDLCEAIATTTAGTTPTQTAVAIIDATRGHVDRPPERRWVRMLRNLVRDRSAGPDDWADLAVAACHHPVIAAAAVLDPACPDDTVTALAAAADTRTWGRIGIDRDAANTTHLWNRPAAIAQACADTMKLGDLIRSAGTPVTPLPAWTIRYLTGRLRGHTAETGEADALPTTRHVRHGTRHIIFERDLTAVEQRDWRHAARQAAGDSSEPADPNRTRNTRSHWWATVPANANADEVIYTIDTLLRRHGRAGGVLIDDPAAPSLWRWYASGDARDFDPAWIADVGAAAAVTLVGCCRGRRHYKHGHVLRQFLEQQVWDADTIQKIAETDTTAGNAVIERQIADDPTDDTLLAAARAGGQWAFTSLQHPDPYVRAAGGQHAVIGEPGKGRWLHNHAGRHPAVPYVPLIVTWIAEQRPNDIDWLVTLAERWEGTLGDLAGLADAVNTDTGQRR